MSDRRTFLRGLASLPLIGGSVTLIGNPTAAAVPVTDGLLDSYQAWLTYERDWLVWERFGGEELRRTRMPAVVWRDPETGRCYDSIRVDNPGGSFDHKGAATRAAVILSAAGVPISDRRRL